MDTLVRNIHEVLSTILARRELDRRTCYTDISALPPHGEIVLSCSEAGVADEVRRELAARPDAGRVRFVVLPNGAGPLPERLVATTSVADIRREPNHAAELVSQAICGDALEPLRHDGDWYLARMDDGYIGWVRSWHVESGTGESVEAFRRKARHRIRDNIATVLETARPAALPVAEAVVGTAVLAERCVRRGWREVTLAGGRQGFVPARSIEPLPRSRRVSRERLAGVAMRFMGIQYLWGGTTPKGFDCSGLIQRIFRLNGVALPRDSDMQARVGRAKPTHRPDALRTGDLMFFGPANGRVSHVAMYLSNALFVHAYGQVRVGSLDPAHPLFDAKLAGEWRSVRDPLG